MFDYSSFPEVPNNNDWIKCWIVFRMVPWDLAGIFLEKLEAEKKLASLPEEYEIAYGSHRKDSDDFFTC